jgi:hypothetical protein
MRAAGRDGDLSERQAQRAAAVRANGGEPGVAIGDAAGIGVVIECDDQRERLRVRVRDLEAELAPSAPVRLHLLEDGAGPGRRRVGRVQRPVAALTRPACGREALPRERRIGGAQEIQVERRAEIGEHGKQRVAVTVGARAVDERQGGDHRRAGDREHGQQCGGLRCARPSRSSRAAADCALGIASMSPSEASRCE